MRKRPTSQLLIASLVFLVFLSSILPIIAQSSAASSITATEKNTVPVLSEALPESVGMSAERLGRIDDLVKEYIDKKWIAGATVLIARDGKIVYYKGLGYDDIHKKTPMKKDAICRIASQTKAITSAAVMMLYEEGKILL